MSKRKKGTYETRDSLLLFWLTEVLFAFARLLSTEGCELAVARFQVVTRFLHGSRFGARIRYAADEVLGTPDAVYVGCGLDVLLDGADQLFGEGEAMLRRGAVRHAEPEGVHAGVPEAVGFEADEEGGGGDGEGVEDLGGVEGLA